MCEDSLVNLLLATHDEATGQTRELLTIGRMLAFCEQRCGYWGPGTGCIRHSRAEWAEILITPGRECRRNEAAGNVARSTAGR